MTQPDTISVAEVANILDVSTKTVRRRYDAGLFTGHRTDGGRGHRTVTPESLAAYLRDHGTPSQCVRARERLGPEFGDWV